MYIFYKKVWFSWFSCKYEWFSGMVFMVFIVFISFVDTLVILKVFIVFMVFIVFIDWIRTCPSQTLAKQTNAKKDNAISGTQRHTFATHPWSFLSCQSCRLAAFLDTPDRGRKKKRTYVPNAPGVAWSVPCDHCRPPPPRPPEVNVV